MEEKQHLEMVEEILEVDSGTLSRSDVLEKIGWDSLANLGLIAEVDTKLGATLDADEIAKCKTVADLLDLIASAERVS